MSNPFDDQSGNSSGNKYGRTYNRAQYDRDQQIQEQCLNKQQQIEDSTTNSLRLVQETLNIGAATAAELDSQGQQIHRVHENLVEINQSVKKSEHHVRGIKSIFGALWNRAKGPPKEEAVSIEPVKIQATASSNSSSSRSNQYSASAPLEKHRLDTDRTHDNLVQIGIGVSSLKEMALSMGDELQRQNVELQKVNEEASKADIGVNKLNKDMTKILKNA